MTSKHITPARKSSFWLEERFLILAVAICTKVMRRFAILRSGFDAISDKSRFDIFKFVALLVCFRRFQLSHLFFKLAYTLNQRRLRRLCFEDFFLVVLMPGVVEPA